MTLRLILLSPLLLAAGAAAALSQVPAPPAAPVASPPSTAAAEAAVPVLVPRIVARYPHDPEAFTQGLVWHKGALYESVGLAGRSDVRRVELRTGKTLTRTPIPAGEFGEGLAAWGNELVSLTWHDGVAHRWSAPKLKPLGTLSYSGEGWGLAADATGFVRSDGSATLVFHDPRTFAERRRLPVTVRGRAITQLNELEMIDGAIFANVWHTPYILRIDPASGRVTAIVDLSAIVAEVGSRDPEHVANGIAWDPSARRLFVTGKRWPTLFEIALPTG